MRLIELCQETKNFILRQKRPRFHVQITTGKPLLSEKKALSYIGAAKKLNVLNFPEEIAGV